MKLNKLKDSLVGLAIVLFFNGCWQIIPYIQIF